MNQKQALRKHILSFGVVLGITLSAIEFLSVALGIIFSTVMGYIFLIVVMLSLLLAVKKYRDSIQKGIISFGDAFVISFFMCLLSGAIWAIYRYIEYSLFPDVLSELVRPVLETLKPTSSPDTNALINMIKEMYIQPAFWAFVTFFFYMAMGGSLLSLYIAFILKREKLPNQ
jgi:hypothetical protein